MCISPAQSLLAFIRRSCCMLAGKTASHPSSSSCLAPYWSTAKMADSKGTIDFPRKSLSLTATLTLQALTLAFVGSVATRLECPRYVRVETTGLCTLQVSSLIPTRGPVPKLTCESRAGLTASQRCTTSARRPASRKRQESLASTRRRISLRTRSPVPSESAARAPGG